MPKPKSPYWGMNLFIFFYCNWGGPLIHAKACYYSTAPNEACHYPNTPIETCHYSNTSNETDLTIQIHQMRHATIRIHQMRHDTIQNCPKWGTLSTNWWFWGQPLFGEFQMRSAITISRQLRCMHAKNHVQGGEWGKPPGAARAVTKPQKISCTTKWSMLHELDSAWDLWLIECSTIECSTNKTF